MELIEWLRAQLDEDEATADRFHYVGCDRLDDEYGSGECDCAEPARRLSEVKAKRAILELHDGGHECSVRDERGEIDRFHYVLDEEACTTVLLLAQVFAGREGWRDEWSLGLAH